MHRKAICLALAVAGFPSTAIASVEPTHHMCDGQWVHQENDTQWRVFRSTAGKVVEIAVHDEYAPDADAKKQALKRLTSRYCGADPHPDVHS